MNIVFRLLLWGRAAEAITAAPGKVFGISPVDLTANLQLDTVITWNRPSMAQWYDVYIGATAGTLVKVGDAQLARSFVPTLALESTYYLRIDAGNSIGVTTGDVTSFSTWAAADVLLDDADDPITDETGEYIDTREIFPFLTTGGDSLVTGDGDRLILLRA